MPDNKPHQIELKKEKKRKKSPHNIPRERPTSRQSTAAATTTANFENFQHEPYDSPLLRTNNFFSFHNIKHLFFLVIVVFEKIIDAEA